MSTLTERAHGTAVEKRGDNTLQGQIKSMEAQFALAMPKPMPTPNEVTMNPQPASSAWRVSTTKMGARASTAPTAENATTAWDDLAERANAFIAAWETTSAAPELNDYLPESPPALRRLVLVELIKIDLENRWQKGDAPKVIEDYLVQFPELNDGGLPSDLIYEEYHVRKQAGDPVQSEQYCQRFPHRAVICVADDVVEKNIIIAVRIAVIRDPRFAVRLHRDCELADAYVIQPALVRHLPELRDDGAKRRVVGTGRVIVRGLPPSRASGAPAVRLPLLTVAPTPTSTSFRHPRTAGVGAAWAWGFAATCSTWPTPTATAG